MAPCLALISLLQSLSSCSGARGLSPFVVSMAGRVCWAAAESCLLCANGGLCRDRKRAIELLLARTAVQDAEEAVVLEEAAVIEAARRAEAAARKAAAAPQRPGGALLLLRSYILHGSFLQWPMLHGLFAFHRQHEPLVLPPQRDGWVSTCMGHRPARFCYYPIC